MKKLLLTLMIVVTALYASAQQIDVNSIQLNVNTFNEAESAKLNQFIESQGNRLGFWGSIGMAVINTIVSFAVDESVSGIIELTELPEKQRSEWNRMIQNECNYRESLSYVNNLTDFYSEGSLHSALDPSDFNFNGFTLSAKHNDKDVLRFYSHVATDEEGLNEIVNHSMFRLVLDSMYFYPYRCHLPNLMANQIFPEEDKTYDRGTSFNFKERSNLSVSINFTITSSWYNQAIILNKDVELGSFSIKIPIDEASLTDSVFVYKRGMPDQQPLEIAGRSFIVPRSYMPLTNGKDHWGTGEYNVEVTVAEHCGVTKEISGNWKKDFRRMKKMRNNQSAWPEIKEYCIQEGKTLFRFTLHSASSEALRQWDWLNQR